MTVSNTSAIKNIVITGSASGIGLGLAREFLKRGHRVIISDRSQEQLSPLQDQMTGYSQQQRLAFKACDVTQIVEVKNLWDFAKKQFGSVDIWYNNAGIPGGNNTVCDSGAESLCRVIDVNVNGVINGCKVALDGMLEQGGGQIYNMSGFGAKGDMRIGMVIYGTSKRAVAYFSKALSKELEGTAVQMGWVNPGMVITPMVIDEAKAMDAERWRQGRKIFNWFGETVEWTCDNLASRILENKSNACNIHLLPTRKILWRLLASLFRKRDLFVGYGV